jgi:hypothetical protein
MSTMMDKVSALSSQHQEAVGPESQTAGNQDEYSTAHKLANPDEMSEAEQRIATRKLIR